jgi:AraC-like DNA-binding protein
MYTFQSLPSINLDTASCSELGPAWGGTAYSDAVSRLYVIREGRAWLRHRGRTVWLEPGYLYVLPAFSVFDYGADELFSQYWIHFTASLPGLQNYFDLFDLEDSIEIDDGPGIITTMDRLIELAESGSLPARMEAAGHILTLIAPFCTEERMLRPGGDLDRVQDVLTFIEESVGRRIEISRLAEKAGLERSYFSRLFSRCMGISPSEYVQRRKIEEARQLLLSTSKTVREIGLNLGFSDEFHFSKVFKKWTGLSPGIYRRQAARP